MTETALTDADLEVIRRARLLADVSLIDGLREHTGEQDVTQAFVDGWAEARHLLRELVAIIERPAGDTGGQDSSEEGAG